MPYIKEEERPPKNDVLIALVENNVNLELLEEILFQFCLRHVKVSYNSFKNYRGEIIECAVELDRRNEKGTLSPKSVIKDMDGEFVGDRDQIVGKIINTMLDPDLGLQVNGDLNYILFAFGKYYFSNKYLFCEALWEAWQRIGDEILGPYEDKKLEENGDV